uniref:PRO0213 n=1 Tax=Homo sapiens TaxID=9606 RepID=Q9P1M4_HUMAN|nr:PRO0213 [Homo sapiens]
MSLPGTGGGNSPYPQLLRICPRPMVNMLHFMFGLCCNKSLFLPSEDVAGLLS